MDLSILVDKFQDEEVLGKLSTAESKAFVDLLILTVLIDQSVSEEELEGLAEQWAQLPFAGDDELEDLMGDHGYKTRAYLEEHVDVEDDDEVNAFLRERIGALTRTPIKEAAIRMVAIVSIADGIDEAEANLCYKIGHVLDIPDSRVREIVEEIVELKLEYADELDIDDEI